MPPLKKKARRQPQRTQQSNLTNKNTQSQSSTHPFYGSNLNAIDRDQSSARDLASLKRIKRHLNDLERTNYTEPSVGNRPLLEVEEDESIENTLEGAAATVGGKRSRTSEALAGTGPGGKKKRSLNVRTLLTYRKTLQNLIDESGLTKQSTAVASYLTASSPPSLTKPPLHLCSVCGYKGLYKCMRCQGQARYCDLGCKAIHDESRCEKR